MRVKYNKLNNYSLINCKIYNINHQHNNRLIPISSLFLSLSLFISNLDRYYYIIVANATNNFISFSFLATLL